MWVFQLFYYDRSGSLAAWRQRVGWKPISHKWSVTGYKSPRTPPRLALGRITVYSEKSTRAASAGHIADQLQGELGTKKTGFPENDTTALRKRTKVISPWRHYPSVYCLANATTRLGKHYAVDRGLSGAWRFVGREPVGDNFRDLLEGLERRDKFFVLNVRNRDPRLKAGNIVNHLGTPKAWLNRGSAGCTAEAQYTPDLYRLGRCRDVTKTRRKDHPVPQLRSPKAAFGGRTIRSRVTGDIRTTPGRSLQE